MNPTTEDAFAKLEAAARMAMAPDADSNASAAPGSSKAKGVAAGLTWIFWKNGRDAARRDPLAQSAKA